jgi:hypothetical protein
MFVKAMQAAGTVDDTDKIAVELEKMKYQGVVSEVPLFFNDRHQVTFATEVLQPRSYPPPIRSCAAGLPLFNRWPAVIISVVIVGLIGFLLERGLFQFIFAGVLAFPWLNPGYRALSFAVTNGYHRDRPLWHGDPVRPGRRYVAWLRWAHGFWRLYSGDPVPRFRPEYVGGDADLGARRRTRRRAVRSSFTAH